MPSHNELVQKAVRHLGPSSDYRIYHYIRGLGVKASPSSVRTRRNELVRAGKIKASGRTELTPAGRRARLWQVAR